MGCLEKIAGLLEENKILEAFDIMDWYIEKIKGLNDKYVELVVHRDFYNGTESNYRLRHILTGTSYTLEKSALALRAFNLAKTICEYVDQKLDPKDLLDLHRQLKRKPDLLNQLGLLYLLDLLDPRDILGLLDILDRQKLLKLRDLLSSLMRQDWRDRRDLLKNKDFILNSLEKIGLRDLLIELDRLGRIDWQYPEGPLSLVTQLFSLAWLFQDEDDVQELRDLRDLLDKRDSLDPRDPKDQLDRLVRLAQRDLLDRLGLLKKPDWRQLRRLLDQLDLIDLLDPRDILGLGHIRDFSKRLDWQDRQDRRKLRNLRDLIYRQDWSLSTDIELRELLGLPNRLDRRKLRKLLDWLDPLEDPEEGEKKHLESTKQNFAESLNKLFTEIESIRKK